MKKNRLLVVVIVLSMVSMALAQNGQNLSQTGPADRAGVLPQPHVQPKQKADEKFLLFQVPALLSAQGTENVDFALLIDGKAYLVERFNIDAEMARRNIVLEALSRDPARLSALYKLAASGKHKLDIAITSNGNIIRNSPFGDFLEYNAKLKKHLRMLPTSIATKIFVVGHLRDDGTIGLADANSDCISGCQANYDACLQSGVCGTQIICDECLNEESACEASCPPPQCSGSTITTSQTAELVAVTFTGSFCGNDVFGNNSIYDEYELLYKVSTIQHTVDNCTGAATDTVIAVSYFTSFCDYSTFLPCDFSFGLVFPC